MNANYVIVRRMIEAGNGPGPIRGMLEAAQAWAAKERGQDAEALKAWLPLVRLDRPFYTPAELAPLWPALKLSLGLETRLMDPPSPNRLANELKFHGLPLVKVDIFPEYFIVERCGFWKNVKFTKEGFEHVLHG